MRLGPELSRSHLTQSPSASFRRWVTWYLGAASAESRMMDASGPPSKMARDKSAASLPPCRIVRKVANMSAFVNPGSSIERFWGIHWR